MGKINFKYVVPIILLISVIAIFLDSQKKTSSSSPEKLKLYWFIPDGLRAEPNIFNIYKWAEEGELPNLKKMMERGSYGYSVPLYPSHTPVNFAGILTGTLPTKNGISDGPMHVEGHELSKVPLSGFNSTSRKLPAVWSYLEKKGIKSGIISTPGSTPPEINNGFIVRGRWSRWGVEFPAVNIEYQNENSLLESAQGLNSCLFFKGPKLTRIFSKMDKGCSFESASSGEVSRLSFEQWGYEFEICSAINGEKQGSVALKINENKIKIFFILFK